MHGSTPHPALGRRSARLLERDSELAMIDVLVREAPTGGGRLLLVEGPAGIGKTRLVAEARRRADGGGLQVLSARGSELERDFPFGVARQLFETLVMDDHAAGRLLQGSAAVAGPVVAPLSDSGELIGDVSFAALHGLYWLCVNLTGDGPLALAIDDLHWCDRPSLRFLAYLVRRLEGLPLLVVGSLRPAEPGADGALLAEIANDPLTVRMRLAPLSAAATGELIGARLGSEPDDAFSAACHRATGGNPLLLNEILSAMEAEDMTPDSAHAARVVRDVGPRAVSRSVAVRLGRLPPEAVTVARAAAVLGDGADLRRVAELAGVDDSGAAQATGLLARAEILRPEPPLGFVHPLVRAAVYHDIAPGERERQHARAARLLVEAGAPEEQVAAHLLASPGAGEEWVVDILVHAARVALRRGAAESAVAYLSRALEERPPPERRPLLLTELGEAQGLLSGPAAATSLRAAFEETDDPALRARAGYSLAKLLMFVGVPAEAMSIAERAAAEVGPDDPDLWKQIEAQRLSVAFYDPVALPLTSDEFLPYRTPKGTDLGARMLSGVAAYQWAMTGGSARECVPLGLHAVGREALEGLESAGVATVGGIIALLMADHDEGDRATQVQLSEGHRTGSLFVASGGYIFRGLALALRGDLGEADRHLRQARDLQDVWGQHNVRLFPAAYHALVLIEQGDLDGARRALDWAGMPADRDLPNNSNMSWWLHARLRYLIASGALGEALELSDDCARRFTDTVVNPAWIPWRSLRAEALHLLGRREEAADAAQAEVPFARRWGAPRTLGRSLRVLGVVGEDMDALEEAVAVLESSPARLELAKACAAYGTALRLARRPTEAREPLRRALELASVCEAAPLVEHVRAEIYATGARPRTDALTGVGALTASERRVAAMAAEGASNKDIAQALYVTPKTVEVHLSSAYRKLGIRSRRELAGALAA